MILAFMAYSIFCNPSCVHSGSLARELMFATSMYTLVPPFVVVVVAFSPNLEISTGAFYFSSSSSLVAVSSVFVSSVFVSSVFVSSVFVSSVFVGTLVCLIQTQTTILFRVVGAFFFLAASTASIPCCV